METQLINTTCQEIYEIMVEKKRDGGLFRGQDKQYPRPMLPSDYRLTNFDPKPLSYTGSKRLRGIGELFFYQETEFNMTYFSGLADPEREIRKYQIKRFLMAHTRNALGYPLAEAFFQQAGMKSEGVDLTDSPDVAMFFSSYVFNQGKYIAKTSDAAPSIIYIWENAAPITPWTLDDLNRYDFYTCPSVIPVRDIFRLFSTNSDDSIVELSLQGYKDAIEWGLFFDLDKIRGHRPFEIIKVSNHGFQRSRINNQSAYLMIPDAILSPTWGNPDIATYTTDKFDINEKRPAFEDITSRKNCKAYSFTPDVIFLESIGINENTIDMLYPTNDILHKILQGWLDDFVKNDYGTIPIPSGNTPFGLDYIEAMEELRSFPDYKYFM